MSTLAIGLLSFLIGCGLFYYTCRFAEARRPLPTIGAFALLVGCIVNIISAFTISGTEATTEMRVVTGLAFTGLVVAFFTQQVEIPLLKRLRRISHGM